MALRRSDDAVAVDAIYGRERQCADIDALREGVIAETQLADYATSRNAANPCGLIRASLVDPCAGAQNT